jgi:hypothetical protein
MTISEMKALVDKLGKKFEKWYIGDYTKDQAKIREIYGYEKTASSEFIAYCVGYLEAKKEMKANTKFTNEGGAA